MVDEFHVFHDPGIIGAIHAAAVVAADGVKGVAALFVEQNDVIGRDSRREFDVAQQTGRELYVAEVVEPAEPFDAVGDVARRSDLNLHRTERRFRERFFMTEIADIVFSRTAFGQADRAEGIFIGIAVFIGDRFGDIANRL